MTPIEITDTHSLPSEIAKVCEATKKIFDAENVPAPNEPVDGILRNVLNYDRDTVVTALGDVGGHVYDFANVADPLHPEISTVADGHLVKGGFVELSSELLELAKYCRDRGFTKVPPHLTRVLSLADGYASVSLKVTTPKKGAVHLTRFVKDPETRREMRSRKNPIDMSLAGFYAHRRDSWDSSPESFQGFAYGNDPYGEEIAKVRRRVSHFESIGLSANAAKIRERLKTLSSASGDRYLGFNPCTPENAAIVAAKVNGFEMVDKRGAPSKLRMPDSAVKKMVKDAGDVSLFDATVGRDYQPRIYPLTSLPVVPKKVSELVDFLDAFPPLGGKPAFDQFGVVTPSLTKQGDIVLSVETSARNREIDHKFIERKVLVPVLLGERDGKTYFISYFAD